MSEPIIPGGYILLSRKLIESEIWSKPPLYLKVWIYLLTKAQHEPYKKLDRGQLITSIPEIAEACSWYIGYRKITPTKDQIFQIIDWLRKRCAQGADNNAKATMITTTKATQHMLITIDNYCFYQNPKNYESNDGGNNEKATKATRKQRQPDNINKNDKNVKNDNYTYSSEIVAYLNEKAGTQYRDSLRKTLNLITARFNEGYTIDDFKKVIDIKTAEWLNTDLAKFLRPETLFGTKFESYLNQKPKESKPNGPQPSYFKKLEYHYED